MKIDKNNMTKTCLVCKKQQIPGDNTRTFHKFPENNDLKQQWMNAINATHVPRSATICSDHFNEHSYHKTDGYTHIRRLLSNAVPSINVNVRVRNNNATSALVYLNHGALILESNSQLKEFCERKCINDSNENICKNGTPETNTGEDSPTDGIYDYMKNEEEIVLYNTETNETNDTEEDSPTDGIYDYVKEEIVLDNTETNETNDIEEDSPTDGIYDYVKNEEEIVLDNIETNETNDTEEDSLTDGIYVYLKSDKESLLVNIENENTLFVLEQFSPNATNQTLKDDLKQQCSYISRKNSSDQNSVADETMATSINEIEITTDDIKEERNKEENNVPKMRFRFMDRFKTIYISREDFVSDEAWQRFMRVLVIIKNQKKALSQQNYRKKVKMNSMKPFVLSHLKGKDHAAVNNLEGGGFTGTGVGTEDFEFDLSESELELMSESESEERETSSDISVLPSEIIDTVEPKPKPGRMRSEDAVDDSKVLKNGQTRIRSGIDAEKTDLELDVTVEKLTLEEQIEEITKRQHSSNYLNSPFKCGLCYKGFINTLAWKHHMGKHDPRAGDIECSICKFRFKTMRNLRNHTKNHQKKYTCKSCFHVSKTLSQAQLHQKWHKGITYPCQYCGEVSIHWTSYLSHLRVKHPSEFICGVCGYSFLSKFGLTVHKKMMHKDVAEKMEAEGEVKEAGPYCEECDVQFVSVDAWKRHMVTSVKHTQTTDFSNGCRDCGETFQSAEELRGHHRKHARKRPKNYSKKPSHITWPAKCEQCNEEILNAREHWNHYRRVHPDKNYPTQKNYICDICGKGFHKNTFLVYHRRTHFEERAYKCEQCPKAFFNRVNLVNHEKAHSDDRPFPCNVCFKAFKSKGALDRHFRCHTGVKPYQCELCGKAFNQSNSRKLHVRTVHLKQPAPYISRSRLERRNKLNALQKDAAGQLLKS